MPRRIPGVRTLRSRARGAAGLAATKARGERKPPIARKTIPQPKRPSKGISPKMQWLLKMSDLGKTQADVDRMTRGGHKPWEAPVTVPPSPPPGRKPLPGGYGPFPGPPGSGLESRIAIRARERGPKVPPQLRRARPAAASARAKAILSRFGPRTRYPQR